jgi:hypothetical protein
VYRVTDTEAVARYRVASSVAWVDSVEGQSAAGTDSAVPADQLPEAWIATVPDGQPLSLNGSGLEIWLACAEAPSAGAGGAGASSAIEPGATASEITDRVRAALGNGEVPVGDVAAFLEELTRRGLVERLGGQVDQA